MKFDERFEAQVLSRTPNVVFSGTAVHPETGWRVGAVLFGRSQAEMLAGGSKFGLDMVTEHNHEGEFPTARLHAFEDVQGAELMPGPNDHLLVKPPGSLLSPFQANALHFMQGEMDVLRLPERED